MLCVHRPDVFSDYRRRAMTTTTEESPPAAVQLPAGPRVPRAIQGVSALINRRAALEMLRGRYGSAFTVNVPIFGRLVVLSDPSHIRELFMAGPDVSDTIDSSLGRVMGPNSLFALSGDRYRAHRKLLTPPFHGRRLAAYEAIVEQEARGEFASWPHDRPFATMPAMTRITLNVMLRAVLGAEGKELERLREMLPPAIRLGSNLVLIPMPQWDWGRLSPWGRFRQYRREYDAVVDRLIDKAHADPNLDARDDVLSLMLHSRYDDGSPMTRAEIADELITFLAAGHETTATTLAWIVERIQRHRALLDRLVAEVDNGSDKLLNATILEVMRTRPAIDSTFRAVKGPTMRIGPWTLPQGQTIIASIGLMNSDEAVFPDPGRFDPDRFLTHPPDPAEYIPYGGGVRRCIGAAFANMEMRVVLRTLLRSYVISPSSAPGERWRSNRVSITPSRGARVRIRPRRRSP
jgi:cytochrome P450 family 138